MPNIPVIQESQFIGCLHSNSYYQVNSTLRAFIDDLEFRDQLPYINSENMTLYCRVALHFGATRVLPILFSYMKELNWSIPQGSLSQFITKEYGKTKISDYFLKTRHGKHILADYENKPAILSKDQLEQLCSLDLGEISESTKSYQFIPSSLDNFSQESKNPYNAFSVKLIGVLQGVGAMLQSPKLKVPIYPAKSSIKEPIEKTIQKMTRQITRPSYRFKEDTSLEVIDNNMCRAIDEDDAQLMGYCIDWLISKNISLSFLFKKSYIGFIDEYAFRTESELKSLYPIKQTSNRELFGICCIEEILKQNSFAILIKLCSYPQLLPGIQQEICLGSFFSEASTKYRGYAIRELLMVICSYPEHIESYWQNVKEYFHYYRLRQILWYAVEPNYLKINNVIRKNEDDFLQYIQRTITNNSSKITPKWLGGLAQFIHVYFPGAELIRKIWLPLPPEMTSGISKQLTLYPRELSYNPAILNMPLKYLLPGVDLQSSIANYSLRILSHGIGTLGLFDSQKINYSGESLELKTHSALIEKENLKPITYLGRDGINIITSPEDTQMPYVQRGKESFMPVATMRNNKLLGGFFASAKTYGSSKEGDVIQTAFDATVTGGCMVGAGMILRDNKGREFSLTSPHIVIPDDFIGEELISSPIPHSYELTMIETLKNHIPFIKATQKGKPVLYYELPTTAYILYGLSLNLEKKMSDELLRDYVKIIKEHHQWYVTELKNLSESLDIEIIPFSTLDSLGFIEQDPLDVLKKLIPEEPNPTLSQVRDVMLEHLKNQPGKVGEVYQYISKQYQQSNPDLPSNNPNPLINLCRVSYMASYALLNAKYNLNINVIMADEESQLFRGYEKIFSKTFGSLKTVSYIPPLIPQETGSNLFYQTKAVPEINRLIQAGLIKYLYLAQGAIAIGSAQFYLDALYKISEILFSNFEDSTTSQHKP